MKKLLINCLATTGLTLIILTTVAYLYQANFLCLSSVYQTLLANILIHIGLIFIRKIESKYFIIEVTIEIGYVMGFLLVYGFVFKWFTNPPLWVVVLIGIAVYIICCIINIFHINGDISFINDQLKLRNAEQSNKNI